jgi:hypothetical protein
MKYLSFLLIPLLSFGIGVKPTSAQDSFASRCYLTGSSMQTNGEGATKYAYVFSGYEICAYYRPNQPILIKGSYDNEFYLPEGKTLEQCVAEMKRNEMIDCL